MEIELTLIEKILLKQILFICIDHAVKKLIFVSTIFQHFELFFWRSSWVLET